MTPGAANPMITGIDEDESLGLQLYPNPTKSHVLVKAEKLITSIDVFDVLGSRIGEISVNSFSKEISLEQLKAGLIVIRVHTSSGTKSVRVVKQ
jgi:hypothetical protein